MNLAPFQADQGGGNQPTRVGCGTQMANLVGELMFAIIRSLVRGWVDSIFKRACERLDARLDRKISKRAALLIGLLLGLAACGFLQIALRSGQ